MNTKLSQHAHDYAIHINSSILCGKKIPNLGTIETMFKMIEALALRVEKLER